MARAGEPAWRGGTTKAPRDPWWYGSRGGGRRVLVITAARPRVLLLIGTRLREQSAAAFAAIVSAWAVGVFKTQMPATR